jgi:AraC family transcriptional regulator, transcriptional activator of pobA
MSPGRAPIDAARLMPAGAREVQAQLFSPALHRQRWSLEGGPAGALSRAVHLSAGRGVLRHSEGEITLHASDIAWLPAGGALELQLDPGSAGVSVGVADVLLAAAMGEREDVAALRYVSARRVVVTAPEGALRDEVVRSLRAIEAEARSGTGGLRPYLAAHLTIVLVGLWRLSSRDAVEPLLPGPGGERLTRFRHLVEAQFRAHWPVARYASELGVSADGLHDLCRRTLQRALLALVHQRLVREACSLLAGTDLSVERLSADLGFASASHFSRFFKRWMGLGPKGWRIQVRQLAAAGVPQQPVSYADWP